MSVASESTKIKLRALPKFLTKSILSVVITSQLYKLLSDSNQLSPLKMNAVSIIDEIVVSLLPVLKRCKKYVSVSHAQSFDFDHLNWIDLLYTMVESGGSNKVTGEGGKF